MAEICILTIGGTIDKIYNQQTGNLDLVSGESIIPMLLEEGKCVRPTIRFQEVLHIDSLQMNDSHRERVLHACQETSEEEDRIIIAHGTDTMHLTAKVIKEAGLPKTVVLLGAMVPWSFCKSDAMFNMGTAIAAVQLLEHGVYVTMNGRIFPSSNVQKNTEKGEFEQIVPMQVKRFAGIEVGYQNPPA